MTILLDPAKPDAATFEVDHQIAIALATLHKSLVSVRGAGRFGTPSASIVLERDGDAETALAVLKSAGIHAVIGAGAQRAEPPR